MRAVFVCGDPADSGLSQPWDQQFGPSGDRDRVLEGECEVRPRGWILLCPCCAHVVASVAEQKRPKGKCWRRDFEIKVSRTYSHWRRHWVKGLERPGQTVTVNSVSPEVLLLRSKSGKRIKSKNTANIGLHIDK